MPPPKPSPADTRRLARHERFDEDDPVVVRTVAGGIRIGLTVEFLVHRCAQMQIADDVPGTVRPDNVP